MLAMLAACQKSGKDPLYQSDAFTLYPDRVVQGDNEAVAVSPNEIRSNYKSPASASFSRLVTFKFSINEKDNESPPGQDHWVLIGDEHESPVVLFGAQPDPKPATPTGFLPPNYNYTFRVDLTPVIRQFDEKGYYEAYDGSRVAKADFKGFYIAGGSEPLTWDFVNLDSHGLKLKDSGKDNIYTITVRLNPYDPDENQDKTWKLAANLGHKPMYRSDQPIVDALFNLSLEEAVKNIEPDSTFRTGAKWGGVWTRDISYSILLAFAYHEPEVARISLMKKVKRDRIIQDTGSGGAWPVSSDRTTWALAAWEIYKVTGDTDWLKKAYAIIKNTLDDDYQTLLSTRTGMYTGESSFLDWREQTYPKWMNNADIFVSENLGTNAVHYQAHVILAEMAKILGQPYQVYEARAENIKNGINQYLWMDPKGFYGQYLYGRPNLSLSPRAEALGESLAVLFDIAGDIQSTSIFQNMPVTPFGVPCIYPQIPGIPPYHNNAVWPFVQSYWNLAAAKTGNEEALNFGLAALYRAGGLFLTNYENFVAETGDYKGTEINSDRMLWSMAGNLAMVHRVFMGMSFEPDGIQFRPVIPKTYPGTKTLTNFKYRAATLDITVNGTGNRIQTINLDGKPLANAFLPADVTGRHAIEIVMAGNDFGGEGINLQPVRFSLPNPQTRENGQDIRWEPLKGAEYYLVYRDGEVMGKTNDAHYEVTSPSATEYKISAVDSSGVESFTSEPMIMMPSSALRVIEVEGFAARSGLPYSDYSGKGFVEISNDRNKSVAIRFSVDESDYYQLDFRYSNGSGPWNTDNKCAIRSLYLNDVYAGVLVFPQRGQDEWSDWGFSNSYTFKLDKGRHTVRLVLEPWNTNMNVDVNTAMLDYLRIIKH